MHTNCEAAFHFVILGSFPLESKRNEVLLVRIGFEKVEEQAAACIRLGAVQQQIDVG